MTVIFNRMDTLDFYELCQLTSTRNVASAKCAILNQYKPNTLRYFNLHFCKQISNRKMQTFKEGVDKIPEGFTPSADLVDDLSIVNGYWLKKVVTYQAS